MSVQVKICGLRTPEALDAALDAGADYVGLVFYDPSPRNIDTRTARQLVERTKGRAKTVALLVDPEDAEIDRIVQEVEPDLFQLHGSETPDRVAEIRKRAGRDVIKAIKIAERGDVESSSLFSDTADLILFDASPAVEQAGTLPGGNGIAFDWRLLRHIKDQSNFILSGGLDPDNVSTAIAVTGATAVDVSSGVERVRGEKNPELIRKFIAAAKAAE